MPIQIGYDDFDTVCYSNQHNIMQLIEHLIAISIQVNINLININNLVNTGGGAVQSLEQRVDALERAFSIMAQRLDSVYNFNDPFINSVTGVIIDNLTRGITP